VLIAAQRLENGGRGEDRLLLEQSEQRTLAIVADGAGGMGGGAVAAEMACSLSAQIMRTMSPRTQDGWEQCLVDVDRALVRSGSGGQCTVVIAEIAKNQIAGVSVGDSGAWLLTARETLDLTELQHRKPLLGSGEASPVRFGPVHFSGRLLLATDGLFKYANRRHIEECAMALTVDAAVERLIAGLRLRSGTLQDDVAIILMENV
jgi:serine/threonine protein phosphatase PrpC